MRASYNMTLIDDIGVVLHTFSKKDIEEKAQRLWAKMDSKKKEPHRKEFNVKKPMAYVAIELAFYIYYIPQFKKRWVEKEWKYFDEKLREKHRRAIRKIAKEFLSI